MTSIHSKLTSANSLHPKIFTHISLDTNASQPSPECHLDVVYILPASVFVDPYQLADLTHSLGKATVFGEQDLELPLEKVHEPRGSIVFLRQTLHSSTSTYNIELPIHLRYQQPAHQKQESKKSIVIEPPFAGWTCGSTSLWPPLSTVEGLLLPKMQDNMSSTTFTRLSTADSKGPEKPLELSVPVGRLDDALLVTIGTLLVVVIGASFIANAVIVALRKRRNSDTKGKRRKSE